MTTATKPDIAPRIVDLDGNAEPFCGGKECPFFEFTEWAGGKVLGYAMTGTLCIPGLRHQRDARTAERDSARREIVADFRPYGGGMEITTDMRQRDYAASRGWSYLYEVKQTEGKVEDDDRSQ